MANRNQFATASGRWTAVCGRLRRVGIGRNRIHWYYAAAICLLVVATALRFYELGQPLAHHDEALAALNSGGTLAAVVHNTRANNSSPLLYPLLLWAVQQVDISPFSIRFLPALSGVLTVAVILLLPRFGVRRDAALLAALLATLAPAAIYEARGAREYGVDALLAALLIAGLLWYRRAGRKALLCGALLAAPLLQYGLVLFGAAVIGAGLLLPAAVASDPVVGSAAVNQSRRQRSLDWLRRRAGLAPPAAFFLAGCVISYLTTLRYHLEIAGPGFALSDHYAELYFIGEYRIIPILEFATAKVWDVVSYHLPLTVIITVAVAVAICLLSASVGRMGRGRGAPAVQARVPGGPEAMVGTLFALALAVAIGAAVLGQYPVRPTRHITYLGPAVFVFSGVALAAAIHRIAAAIPSRTKLTPFLAIARPERRTATLAIIIAVMIIGASLVAMRQDSPYQVVKSDDFFGILDESVQADDFVYITGSTAPIMSFYGAYYRQQWPSNYIQGKHGCWDNYSMCIREISNVVAERENDINDVWIIFHDNLSKQLDRYDQRGTIEYFEDFNAARSKWIRPSLALHRFPADGGLLDSVRRLWAGSASEAEWPFEVYYSAGRLTYEREPCAPADTEAWFFLHIFPAGSLNVLPESQRPYGFDNLDFNFAEKKGALLENRCVVSVALPHYDLARIRTGQYDSDGRIWQADIAVPNATQYAAYAAAAATPPAARSVFNLHLDGDTLLYAKSPCATADTAAPFFLHLYPADLNVLPETQRPYGFDNRDFRFAPDGALFDGKCFIRVLLPEYEMTGIHTGQHNGDVRIWAVEFAP